jgi:CBS domain-containing protein
MKPIDKVRAVSPETPATQVLEMMAKDDLNQVPVTADQKLVGMLTRSEILEAVRSRLELKPK